MIAAVALLFVMVLTVTMFELSVNNRFHAPRERDEAGEITESALGAPDVPRS
ncbi:hypothetical protein [Sphaerisporangium album]|uniref:hypothetical protein n=1 Tax=Sphaerisporangium album TaxID=509200 RepID=UPI0015F0C635|nr:hypothetical protein [Sphaerisporangium album]